jgi:hypothetical protein
MSHRFIAAEFKGLAREFRRRVEAADSVYGVALNKIVRPLEARLARKPKLRDGTMIDVARALQAINHPFRFRLSIDTPKRGHAAQIGKQLGKIAADRTAADQPGEVGNGGH